MNRGNLSLSVIIPVYNEEAVIESTLKKINNYLTKTLRTNEIIVINDGSMDGSLKILKTLATQNPSIKILENTTNQGKGFSLKRGILDARGDYILLSDADLSTPIEEIEKLLFWLNKNFDIAIGSRGLPNSDIRIHQPWYREKMGKICLYLKVLLK